MVTDEHSFSGSPRGEEEEKKKKKKATPSTNRPPPPPLELWSIIRRPRNATELRENLGLAEVRRYKSHVLFYSRPPRSPRPLVGGRLERESSIAPLRLARCRGRSLTFVSRVPNSVLSHMFRILLRGLSFIGSFFIIPLERQYSSNL